jgi:hypothetical protein
VKNHGIKKATSIFVFVCLLLTLGVVKASPPTILVQLTIGSKTATVNGKEVTLDVPPMVINGRTLVPLRFISESMGSTIVFDAPTRTIKISAFDGPALQQLALENEKEIAALKKQLENTTGGLQSETISPEIMVNNILENQIISKATILNITLNDQSPIAFVRTKLGNMLLSENIKNLGTIDPSKLISGNYSIGIEAWDAFGNKGEKKIAITIQNSELAEPLVLKAETKEMKRGGPPGGGPGGPGGPGGGDENPMKIASLIVTMSNNSLSTLEITKVEVFDQAGNLKQLRSDAGVIDMLKRTSGLNHILIIPTDSISLQVANAPVEEGKEIKDVYKGWKVVITFFDSIQQKEMAKFIVVN